ncbi:hypothetical protein CYMTET_4577 [Cymbomonas tetramitiformis]|uniref:Uncharacterized protein n=1 Tax=Cymbomonas tetramitiformis TaxID=36881 RepID=A0AAE0H179_9CHLO|nr:hypothetical protein CYMTET_4577 [Cymbomonas tetramitiformis]
MSAQSIPPATRCAVSSIPDFHTGCQILLCQLSFSGLCWCTCREDLREDFGFDGATAGKTSGFMVCHFGCFLGARTGEKGWTGYRFAKTSGSRPMVKAKSTRPSLGA